MPGWTTDGVSPLTTFSGLEQWSADTQGAAGVYPQTGAVSVIQMAALVSFYGTTTSHATVAGTRYYTGVNLGIQPLTGISVKVGATGGTDSWIVELHSSTGALLATSALAGTTAGAANTWQNIPFTASYTPTSAGLYYFALQSNGTTATYSAIAAPTYPFFTGSATGTFGTSASITPPTTYTSGVGPFFGPYT